MVRGLPGVSLSVPHAREMTGDIRLLTPDDQDRELLRTAHNDAFRDHWGAGEKSQEAWEHERSATPAARVLPKRACREPLSVAAASGEYDLVELWADSDSPTGATQLYERVGFTRDKTIAAMHRPGPWAPESQRPSQLRGRACARRLKG